MAYAPRSSVLDTWVAIAARGGSLYPFFHRPAKEKGDGDETDRSTAAFELFALVMVLIPFRRDERWAWYTLRMLPVMWVFQFVFSPDLTYLMLAALTTIGLLLPFRRFFPSPE